MIKQNTVQNPAALDAQKLFRRSIKLIPVLARRGLAPGDALAVAFNTAYLFYGLSCAGTFPRAGFMLSPKAILRKYSYAEIASLCEHLLGTAEFAVNKSFKEVLP